MDVGNLVRRLRAVVGNAIVWGVGWFVGTFAVGLTLQLLSGGLNAASFRGILQFALRASVIGGIAAGAFSTFIILRYQGRRLSELNWVRFAIGGAVVTGLFIPGFIILMRLLSGDPFLPLRNLLNNALFGAVFGGAAAGASLKLAQMADRLLPGRPRDRLERGEES